MAMVCSRLKATMSCLGENQEHAVPMASASSVSPSSEGWAGVGMVGQFVRDLRKASAMHRWEEEKKLLLSGVDVCSRCRMYHVCLVAVLGVAGGGCWVGG